MVLFFCIGVQVVADFLPLPTGLIKFLPHPEMIGTGHFRWLGRVGGGVSINDYYEA